MRVAALLLCIATAGCSIVGSRPPVSPSDTSCKAPIRDPVVDTVLSVVLTTASAIAFATHDCRSCEDPMNASPMVGGILAVPAALYSASAIYGYRAAVRCNNAHIIGVPAALDLRDASASAKP
jgi:hypothetical protein